MKRAIVSHYSMWFPNHPKLYSMKTKQGRTALRLHNLNSSRFAHFSPTMVERPLKHCPWKMGPRKVRP